MTRLPCASCVLLYVGFFIVPTRYWERYPARVMILLDHAHQKGHR